MFNLFLCGDSDFFFINQSTYEKQQVKLKTAESSEATYLDQIEELTHKLSQAESRIKQFETARLQEGAKVRIYFCSSFSLPFLVKVRIH